MKQALAIIVMLGSFVYLVVLMVMHPHWAKSNIAFFDAWYEWYPALVGMVVALHLDGAFLPKS